VNDCAVKLAIIDFNEVLTKNAMQRDLLYQVIEYHWKLMTTNAKKKQLVDNYRE